MLTGFKSKKYALLGNVPSRAFSTRLHGMLADYQYEYIPTAKSTLREIISDTSYDGFNITYPLKEAIIPYVTELSDAALRSGCVNAVIRRDGGLYGDNTDYTAFLRLLSFNRIVTEGKKVIVLGSGATSKAICAALEDSGAEEIVVISRRGEDDYSSLSMHDDAALLVNTTPVGATPNYASSPVSLRYFKNLEMVIDVVYDPSRTELMLEAEEYGIPSVGGFNMLVYHTKLSCELFTGKKVSDLTARRAGASFEAELNNVVLVGMPGCGKSVIAVELAKSLGKQVIDTDNEVSHLTGLSIPETYELFGEEYFRQKEEEVIKKAARGSGAVIACGAGAILREENIKELRRRSTVIFLRREIERIATSGSVKIGRDSLMKLYSERIPLYLAASDIIIDVGDTPKDTVKTIVKSIYKK
ncbi:MAG: hypothetical protein IJS45_00815 [Clostridia bacterium]|nr:hypothetical protein [Clostridia bacterium]